MRSAIGLCTYTHLRVEGPRRHHHHHERGLVQPLYFDAAKTAPSCLTIRASGCPSCPRTPSRCPGPTCSMTASCAGGAELPQARGVPLLQLGHRCWPVRLTPACGRGRGVRRTARTRPAPPLLRQVHHVCERHQCDGEHVRQPVRHRVRAASRTGPSCQWSKSPRSKWVPVAHSSALP
jgi:hypothetical protein